MVHCPWNDEKGRQAWYRDEWTKSRRHLAGKTVMVTGAASGIGHAITRRLLTDTKADIVAVDIDAARLAAWRDDRDNGWRVTPIVCDLADPDAVDHLPSGVDILVNNAGRLTPASLREVSMRDVEHTLRVMLHAPIQLTRAVLPHMHARGDGLIINMGSVYSLTGGDDKGAYAIAKHGLLGLTRQIALEEARHGVRSVLIAPAHVASPLLTRQCIDEAALLRVPPEDRATALAGQLATNEFVLPDEVAAACVYLTRPEARSITGCAFEIDGGWLAGTRSRPVTPLVATG